jgi:hypothetical protein
VNVTVFAQETDSIYTRQYQLREIFWKQFIQNPNVQQNLSLADFTETSLYIEIKNQPLSIKQNPNEVSNYGFKTKGIFSLKNNFKLFGNLDFSRSYTKEYSYQLFQNNTEEFSNQFLISPNYPLAIRQGNGKNLHYHLTGGITGFITESIPFSAMINYNLDKFFGLTIPKTEQEVINYSGDFKVGYKTGNHHVFGILKLEKEQNNFNFNTQSTNTTPINSLAYPNSYAGFSVGYGDVIGYNGALLAGITDTEAKTYGLGYNFIKRNYSINSSYSYVDNKERYYSTEYLELNNLAAIFKRKEHKFYATYVTHFNNNHLIVSGEFISGKGINTHAFENYVENTNDDIINKNYQQLINQTSIDAYWEKRQNNKTHLGLNLSAEIKDNSIKDLNTTVQDMVSFKTAVSANKDLSLNKKSILNIEAGTSFYTPLSNSLSYMSSNSSTNTGTIIPPRNTFGVDVIQYNYNFYTLDRLGLSLGLRYQTTMKKNTIATISLKYATLMALSNSDLFSKNNNGFNLSINLKY